MPMIPDESVGLSADTIAALLNKPERRSKTSKTKSDDTEVRKGYPGARSYGPLRHLPDSPGRCVRRGCSTPTVFKLKGISYCTSHLFQEMNKLIIELDETYTVDLSQCTCKTGYYTGSNKHTSDCAIYETIGQFNGTG